MLLSPEFLTFPAGGHAAGALLGVTLAVRVGRLRSVLVENRSISLPHVELSPRTGDSEVLFHQLD
jgi:hypothetical protein